MYVVGAEPVERGKGRA